MRTLAKYIVISSVKTIVALPRSLHLVECISFRILRIYFEKRLYFEDDSEYKMIQVLI